jgi:radical SAM protein with 4Fe4S-binding SPASM domain
MAEFSKNGVYGEQKVTGRLDDAGIFPKVVLIDTTSFCNLKCSMCVHKDMKRKKGNMSWKLFTKIIDEIAATEKKTRVWMVFFGEALILKRTKPSIFDMIRYGKDSGLRDVVLNSNANLLDKEAAQGLIDSGLDAIYIGIDAATAQTYQRIRVGGDYRQTVKNVLRIIELKKKVGAVNPRIFVQFVEMESNKSEKELFISFWKKHGVTVKIRPMVSWAGSIAAPNLIMPNSQRWPCYWAMQTMSITNEGKVVTCAVDLDARYVAGDANKMTLKKIWNSKLKKIRQLHRLGKFSQLPRICSECRDWQSARADYYS